MKYVILSLLVAVNVSAAVANPVIDYSDACKDSAASLKSDKRVKAAVREEMEIALEELHLQSSIILNDTEDADFRLQVFGIAETSRQAVNYSLDLLAAIDARLSQRIIKSCKLEKLGISINQHFSEVYEQLLIEADGIDSGDGEKACSFVPQIFGAL